MVEKSQWEKLGSSAQTSTGRETNLSGGGVRADVQLAGAGARIVHRAQHLLAVHQHLDLLPGWHALPALGLLQGLADE